MGHSPSAAGFLKISPVVLLLAGAFVGALAWGSCNAGKASDAEVRLEEALIAHRDSAAQWDKARQALTVSLGALRRDSSTLARQYAVARQMASTARHRGDSLLALLPDTLRVAVRLTFDSLTGEALACRGLLVNCELRAANAEARVQGDSLQLRATRLLLDSMEVQWHIALQRNAPGFLGLRAFWKARSYTLPLTALSAFLLLQRR